MSGPDWNNVDLAKRWLGQRFVGGVEAGSELYQYLMTLGLETDGREEHLSTFELVRWLSANKISGGVHYPAPDASIIFYPEYQHPTHSSDNKNQGRTTRKQKITKTLEATPRRQTKSVRAGNSNSSSRLTKNNQSKTPLQPKVNAKCSGRQSKGTMKTDPKTTRQLEARVRTLRPGIGDRKQVRTDLVCLNDQNSSTSQDHAGFG